VCVLCYEDAEEGFVVCVRDSGEMKRRSCLSEVRGGSVGKSGKVEFTHPLLALRNLVWSVTMLSVFIGNGKAPVCRYCRRFGAKTAKHN